MFGHVSAVEVGFVVVIAILFLVAAFGPRRKPEEKPWEAMTKDEQRAILRRQWGDDEPLM